MTNTPPERETGPHPIVRIARIVIPIAISIGIFGYLFFRIDARAVADSVSLTIIARWAMPLVVFNFVTLAIEAHCLHRVAQVANARLTHLTAARIKAACYLLSVLNYAFGAAGLSVLLRRRARIGLADAASVVFLVSLFDIGAVLCLAAAGAAFLQTDALGIRIGLIGALIFAMAAGLIFLKIPMHLGPLERIRGLDIFRAPRTAPVSLLIELGILRIVFVGCYVALAGSLFWAFEIEVEPIRLGLNMAILLVVSALPIAAGGLGTGQWVFVELFRGLAPDAQLLAASLVFSFGLITTRALLGLSFALEFTREVLDASHEDGDE